MTRTTEWLTQNAYRRYPVVENTDMTLAGGIVIPDNTLLDFQAVCYAEDSQPALLQSVDVIGSGPKTFIFTFLIGSTAFAFTVSDTAAFPYTDTVYSAGVQAGTCVFGEGIIELAGVLAAGSYLPVGNIELEPSCICFQDLRRVNSLLGTDAGSVQIAGDVYLKEGYNCSITIDPDSNTIRIDGVRGAGAGLPCGDPPVSQLTCKQVFLRINGLTADDQGEFTMTAGQGLTLTADPAAHKLVFKSAKSGTETVCNPST